MVGGGGSSAVSVGALGGHAPDADNTAHGPVVGATKNPVFVERASPLGCRVPVDNPTISRRELKEMEGHTPSMSTDGAREKALVAQIWMNARKGFIERREDGSLKLPARIGTTSATAVWRRAAVDRRRGTAGKAPCSNLTLEDAWDSSVDDRYLLLCPCFLVLVFEVSLEFLVVTPPPTLTCHSDPLAPGRPIRYIDRCSS